MVLPISRPAKKDPQRRTRVPVSPPPQRSRSALNLAAAAAEGRFVLQHCEKCGAVQYPPRDVCGQCLSSRLQWRDSDPWGQVIALTSVHTSHHVYFRERGPWPVAIVHLNAGPSVICYLHSDCQRGDRVRLINRLDKGGQAVLMAMPAQETTHMSDDKTFRELSCDPKYRRVLITDGRSELGLELAQALTRTGASLVFVGEAESWRFYPHREALKTLPNVELLPLDVTDTESVRTLCAEIGGKVDILINNARFIRPGGILARQDVVFARDEIEVNYLGLTRLAQSFAPLMRARGADGTHSAVAWVNLFSVFALSNHPAFGAFSASHAAALSLSQNLRAHLQPSGVRVVNVFSGPTDDAWHQPLPPPKQSAKALARTLVNALRDGLEDVYGDPVAVDIVERWRRNPKVLERELAREYDDD